MTFLFWVSPGEVKNQDHFRYAEETKLAWEEGKLSEDIVEEQRKLTQADLVIFQVCVLSQYWEFCGSSSQPSCQMFWLYLLGKIYFCSQFPMYWFSVPGIMKGWIDRVLTSGYAFTQEKRYSQGIFKVRAAVQICHEMDRQGLDELTALLCCLGQEGHAVLHHRLQ